MSFLGYDLKEQIKNLTPEFIRFLEAECDDPQDDDKLFIHNYLKKKGLVKERIELNALSKEFCSLNQIPTNFILEHLDNAINIITKLPSTIQRKILKNLKTERSPYFDNSFNDPLFANNFLKLQTLSQVEVYEDNYFVTDRYNYILLDEARIFINLSHFKFNIVSLNNYPNIKFIDKKSITLSHNFFPTKKDFMFMSSNFVNCNEFYKYINDNYEDLNWDLEFLFKLPAWFRYVLINNLKERINPDRMRNLNLFELVRNNAPIDLIEFSIGLGNSWEISQVSALLYNKGIHVPRLKRKTNIIHRQRKWDKNFYKNLENNIEINIDRAIRKGKYLPTKIIVNEINVEYIKQLKERGLLQNSGKTFFNKYLLTNSQFFGTDKWFSLSEHLIKKALYESN